MDSDDCSHIAIARKSRYSPRMSFAEVKEEVLRMTDAQKQKLMRLLLESRAQRNDRWLADMERRMRKAKRSESLTRTQVIAKDGISEAEIRREACSFRLGSKSVRPKPAEKPSRAWFAEIERRKKEMKPGSKFSRKEAMSMLGIPEADLARKH